MHSRADFDGRTAGLLGALSAWCDAHELTSDVMLCRIRNVSKATRLTRPEIRFYPRLDKSELVAALNFDDRRQSILLVNGRGGGLLKRHRDLQI